MCGLHPASHAVSDQDGKELDQAQQSPMRKFHPVTAVGRMINLAAQEGIGDELNSAAPGLRGLAVRKRGQRETASTQRAQSVGCCGCVPTSVSQCQQRSHFSPDALPTVIRRSSRSVTATSSCDTLSNSRSAA